MPVPMEILVGGKPVIALTPLDHRVKVGLVVPRLGRVIDVTVQPATACRALNDAAQLARLDAPSVEASTREAITAAVEISDAWHPSPDAALSASFGGIAFPLLGAAYDAGASPVSEVPRWAEPILASLTFGQGAIEAFGERATRPVKRALVEALRPLPTGQIPFGVLALALMGREVLQPDRLVRVLSCDRALHPTPNLPDPSTLSAAREAFNRWGDIRTERVLVDAAVRPDGLSLLMKTVLYALQLGDHGPTRLPNRLSDLHDTYRVMIPTATEPVTPPPRERSVRRRRAHHPVLAPLQAPRGTPAVSSGQRLIAPANIRALDGTVHEDLRFVLPRTVGDLDRWGRLLSNCLADFGPSISAGRSFIVGVERDHQLTYAIEINARNAIRQFNGRANRPPTVRDRRTIIAALVEAGAITPPEYF